MTGSSRHDRKRSSMAVKLEGQTGRSLEAWVDTVEQADVEGFMNIVEWLKGSHGLGHFQARLVAEAHRDRPG